MENFDNTNDTTPGSEAAETVTLTRAEVAQMIDERISALRIYVLESDITDAQNNLKAIIERASF